MVLWGVPYLWDAVDRPLCKYLKAAVSWVKKIQLTWQQMRRNRDTGSNIYIFSTDKVNKIIYILRVDSSNVQYNSSLVHGARHSAPQFAKGGPTRHVNNWLWWALNRDIEGRAARWPFTRSYPLICARVRVTWVPYSNNWYGKKTWSEEMRARIIMTVCSVFLLHNLTASSKIS